MSNFADLPSVLQLHLCWVNAQQWFDLEQYFGSIAEALQADKKSLIASEVLKSPQLDKWFSTELSQQIEQALDWAEEPNQGWLSWQDKDFPQRCREIDDAPILLGYKGNKGLLNDPQIAVVGSRHASKAGREIAQDFAGFLSENGLSITSGLALGIDTAAHKGGLQGVGKTVAVVATGLDRIYPASNKALGQQIVEEGVMLSEFALGTKPLSYHFPKRNRIISGLSYGTLVVEAALKSGSLITARTAMEQGREVFAVPGSIHNPQAKGCHQLIKQGAKLVESGSDILEELSSLLQDELLPAPSMSTRLTRAATKEPVSNQLDLLMGDNAQVHSQYDEHPILKFIEFEPISLDELVVLSKKPVSSLQGELMLLELAGRIEALSGARWRRLK